MWRKISKPVADLPAGLPELDFRISFSAEVCVKMTEVGNARDALSKERQDVLFSVADVLSVNDDNPVPNFNFSTHAQRTAKELLLNKEARMAVEGGTLSQSAWPKWHVRNIGWITASAAHQVLTESKSSTTDCLVRDIM